MEDFHKLGDLMPGTLVRFKNVNRTIYRVLATDGKSVYLHWAARGEDIYSSDEANASAGVDCVIARDHEAFERLQDINVASGWIVEVPRDEAPVCYDDARLEWDR